MAERIVTVGLDRKTNKLQIFTNGTYERTVPFNNPKDGRTRAGKIVVSNHLTI